MNRSPLAAPSWDVVAIPDPELDVGVVAAQITAEALREHRRRLGWALEELRQAILHYGTVGSTRCGWAGRLELWIKRGVRKVIQRHVVQQQQVHHALLGVLHQVVQCLEHQERLLRPRLDGDELPRPGAAFDAASDQQASPRMRAA